MGIDDQKLDALGKVVDTGLKVADKTNQIPLAIVCVVQLGIIVWLITQLINFSNVRVSDVISISRDAAKQELDTRLEPVVEEVVKTNQELKESVREFTKKHQEE